MVHKIGEVRVDETTLLHKQYSASEMVGKTFTITEITLVEGDYGYYVVCTVEGDGLEPGRKFSTGATNIVARLQAAVAQGLLPLEVTVTKLGNAFDIA